MDNQNRTVVGVFTDRLQANNALDELTRLGFTAKEVGIVGREVTETTGDHEGSHAGTGAAAGAVAGLGLGGLAGLGVLSGLIPVIGPAIAGGTLAVILSNAAGGAAIGGLAGTLVGAGVPEEDVEHYNREFEAGRYLVTAMAGARADQVWEIFQRHGAADIHQNPTVGVGGSTKSWR